MKISSPTGVTQIEFLVDNSGSMNSNCGNREMQGVDGYVNFILDTLKSGIQAENHDSIFVGVSAFSDSFSTITPPVSLNSFNKEIKIDNKPENHGGTNLLAGITESYDALQKFGHNADTILSRYLIVITDGDIGNIDIIRAKIMDLLPQEPLLRVYVVLWCSPVMQNWTNLSGTPVVSTVPDGGEFTVFPDVESMTIKFMDNLSPYFYDDIKIKRATSEDEMTMFGGYYKSVNVSFWSIANTLKVISEDGTSLLLPGEGKGVEFSPTEECFVHEVKTRLDEIKGDSVSQGLIMFTPRVLPSLHLELEYVQIVNGNPVEVNFKILSSSKSVSKELDEYKNCFRAEPIVNEYSMHGVTSDFCDNTGFVCLSDGLHGKFQWEPLLPNNTGVTTELRVKLHGLDKKTDGGQNISYSWVAFASAVVNTQPVYDGTILYSEGIEDIIRRGYEFDYVEQEPEIFLLTTLSDDELYAQSRKLSESDGEKSCKLPTDSFLIEENPVRVKPVEEIFAVTGFENHDEPLRANKGVRLSYLNVQNNKIRYDLEIYTYMVLDCGFDQLMFKWNKNEQKGVSEITWLCDIFQEEKCQFVNVTR